MIAAARQPSTLQGVRGGFALLCLLLLGVAAADTPPSGLQPIPALHARVTDLTGTLTSQQQTALEQKLAAFEASKGSQLAVLIVPTTQPEEIEQYSIRVVDQWKLGRGSVGGKKVDDGALLLVAKNDHRVRIEVGYGLEGVLTDAISNRIISETVAPAFRRGDFYGGIDAGLDQMMRLIQGEPLPPPPQSQWQGAQHHGGGGSNLLVFLFLGVWVGSSVLRAMFGRTVGSALTAGLAGILVWFVVHVLLFAGLAAIAAFVLAMIAGVARGSGWSSYPRAGGFGGGWGGFGGGLGGGGGGFSGGGGGFGGGGASGSW
jgi:uncharacterized protein